MQGAQLRSSTPDEIQRALAQLSGAPPPKPMSLGTLTDMEMATAQGTPPGGLPPLPPIKNPPPLRTGRVPPSEVDRIAGKPGGELVMGAIEAGADAVGAAHRAITPERAASASRTVVPAAGSVVGGIIGGGIGARSGSPNAAVAGSVVGSGIGGTVGEAASMGLEYGFGLPPSRQDAMTRLESAGKTAMLSDVAGHGVGKVIGKVAAPFASHVTQRGRALMETLTPKNVLPGSVVKHPVMDFFENIARYGPTGMTRMRNAEADTQRAIDEYTTQLLEQFGPKAAAPQAAGEGLQGVTRKIERDVAEGLSERYRGLWEDAKGRGFETLDASGLLARGTELGAEAGSLGKSAGALEGSARAVGSLESAGAQAAEAQVVPGMQHAQAALANLDPADPRRARLVQELNEVTSGITDPSKLTPEQVHKLRSFYNKMSAQFEGRTERGQFAQLAKAADDVLKQLPEDIQATYKGVTKDYAEYADTFKQGAIREFIKRHAKSEKYLTTLIKPHDVKTVQMLTKHLPHEDLQKLRRGFAESLLDNGQEGVVTPAELAHKLGKKGFGPEVIQEMFPQGTYHGFYQLQRVLEDTVGRRKEGTGKIWIQMSTPSAIAGTGAAALGILTGSVTTGGAGAVIVLTPNILARIMTSKTGREWLTTGLSAGRKTLTGRLTDLARNEKAQKAATNLVGFLVREGIITPGGMLPGGRQGGPGAQPNTAPPGRGAGAASGPPARSGG